MARQIDNARAAGPEASRANSVPTYPRPERDREAAQRAARGDGMPQQIDSPNLRPTDKL